MRSSVAKVAATVVATLAVGSLGFTAPAQASTETFNPFDVNRGFTVVAQGNAVLGNGELKGAVAAFGSVSSRTENFPLSHSRWGAEGYQVPSIDGDPVRILARQFTGTGGFDLTNE